MRGWRSPRTLRLRGRRRSRSRERVWHPCYHRRPCQGATARPPQASDSLRYHRRPCQAPNPRRLLVDRWRGPEPGRSAPKWKGARTLGVGAPQPERRAPWSSPRRTAAKTGEPARRPFSTDLGSWNPQASLAAGRRPRSRRRSALHPNTAARRNRASHAGSTCRRVGLSWSAARAKCRSTDSRPRRPRRPEPQPARPASRRAPSRGCARAALTRTSRPSTRGGRQGCPGRAPARPGRSEDHGEACRATAAPKAYDSPAAKAARSPEADREALTTGPGSG
jgi:hypothetical protein